MSFSPVFSAFFHPLPALRARWRCQLGVGWLKTFAWALAVLGSWATAVPLCLAADASSPPPKLKLPARSPRIESFVPTGWRLERKVPGDLNGDGLEDMVLILKGTDTDNIILGPDGNPSSALDTNPRVMVGLAAGDDGRGGYVVAFQSTELIPRRDSANLDEPLREVNIEDGLLVVALHFWTHTGAWPGSETVFRFKSEPGCLRLVAYENVETQRVSKETEGVSIDYLEGVVETIKSKGGGKGGFKTQRGRFEKHDPVCVDEIGNGWDYDPKVSADQPDHKASRPMDARVR